MTDWIALLRGVNVGGITIRSADLAEVFTGLGFHGVRTFLASGNVRFETDAAASARPKTKATIEKALGDRFGYDAWIVLITRDELERAIEGFPFDPENTARQPWVIFGSDQTALDELAEAAATFDASTDPLAIAPGVLYWNPMKGTTVDTPFGKLLARKTYRTSTTNRNLRTLRKILD